MKLIDQWRQWWRFWSVRLSAVALVLEALGQAWAQLPDDVKALLPSSTLHLLSGVFVACSMIARIIKQEALANGRS